MHIYRSFVAIVIAALAIMFSLRFSSASAAQATDGCSQTYTVQPGDWLFAIARRFNIPITELIRLNPQLSRNPNLIYPWQVLCVSMTAPTPPPDGAVSEPRAVAIEANYQYVPNEDEMNWNLTARGGFVGKRRVLTVPGFDAIEVYSLTEEVFSAISNTAPVLLGVRNSVTATTYTLVIVGRQDILSSIRLTGTVTPNPECVKAPTIQATLSITDVNVQDVTVWLEGGSEQRFPFHIGNIDAKPDWNSASVCYVLKVDRIGFALFPAASGKSDEYRIMIRLTSEGYGPPNYGWYNRCVSLSYGGWFNWWFRSWACPRY